VLTIRPDYFMEWFSQSDADDLLKPFGIVMQANNSKVPVDSKAFLDISNIFEKMSVEINSKQYKAGFLISLYVSEILVLIGRALHSIDNNMEKMHTGTIIDENISRIIRYINKSINEDLTMDILEKNLNLSRYYLCHIFKQKTGFSIFEYILNRRIAESKKYLSETAMPVTEIALSLRFSDVSHFSRSFKKIVGIPPNVYRMTECSLGK
jgi:AraC-like DNA-binding protein